MEIVNIKCGEIYLTKNSSYYFHCIHCDENFYCLDYFKKHNFNHFLIDINSVPSSIPVGNENNIYERKIEDLNIEMLDISIERNYHKIKVNDIKSITANIKKETFCASEIEGHDNLIEYYEENENSSQNFKIELNEFNFNDESYDCSNEIDSFSYNGKLIKVEIENSNDGSSILSKDELVDSNVIHCPHCKLNFDNNQKHNFNICEKIQKECIQFQGNLKILKKEIYSCKYCPSYFENSKEISFHEKTHLEENAVIKSNKYYININEIESNNSCNSESSLSIIDSNDNELIKHQFENGNNEIYFSEETVPDLEKNIIKDKSTKCLHCNVAFKNFHNHNRNKCQKIQKIIESKPKNYMQILRKRQIYLCEECPRYFDKERKLIIHRRKHYNNGQCPVCLKSFKKLEIIEHILKIHPEITQDKIQLECKSDEIKKIYECFYCNKKFVSETYWKRHVLIHENKELQCSFCNKMCQSPIILKNHLRTHTGERPFICQLCPAAFSLKHNLDLHFIYKHTDERPFECRYDGGCGKSFKTDQLRNYHERRHTGEILGKCEICDIEYRNKSAFRKHMKLRHMNYNERPHQCEYCDKKFVENGRLREHIRTHTGEKPLQCDMCFKSFARYSVLREHKKLHSGTKNHVCSICGKAFAQTAGYFNHLKYHS